MFIVIKNDNVTIKRSLKDINKKLKTNFVKEDFKNLNSNYVMNIDNLDLDYKKDVTELNRVFVQKLYKKDNDKLFIYGFLIIILLISIMTLSSVNASNGIIETLVQQKPGIGVMLP